MGAYGDPFTCEALDGRWLACDVSAHGVRDTCRGSRVCCASSGPRPRPGVVHMAHCDASAWTAAWLTARGRDVVVPRQMLIRPEWRGQLHWRERGETRRRGHRPDLAARLPDGAVLPIEVELTEKSPERLKAVFALHVEWLMSGHSAGVIYVCASQCLPSACRPWERVLA